MELSISEIPPNKEGYFPKRGHQIICICFALNACHVFVVCTLLAMGNNGTARVVGKMQDEVIVEGRKMVKASVFYIHICGS